MQKLIMQMEALNWLSPAFKIIMWISFLKACSNYQLKKKPTSKRSFIIRSIHKWRKTPGLSIRPLTTVLTCLSINQRYYLVKFDLWHFYFVSINLEGFIVHSAFNMRRFYVVPATSNSSSSLRLGFLRNQPSLFILCHDFHRI